MISIISAALEANSASDMDDPLMFLRARDDNDAFMITDIGLGWLGCWWDSRLYEVMREVSLGG